MATLKENSLGIKYFPVPSLKSINGKPVLIISNGTNEKFVIEGAIPKSHFLYKSFISALLNLPKFSPLINFLSLVEPK